MAETGTERSSQYAEEGDTKDPYAQNTADENTATGFSMASFKRVFTSPHGLLRVVEFVCAVAMNDRHLPANIICDVHHGVAVCIDCVRCDGRCRRKRKQSNFI